jgi:WD40 repeat protein
VIKFQILTDPSLLQLASLEPSGLKQTPRTMAQCPLTVDSSVDSSVKSVAFSPDGSKIAAAHSNNIQIFDARTEAKLGSLLNVL